MSSFENQLNYRLHQCDPYRLSLLRGQGKERTGGERNRAGGRVPQFWHPEHSLAVQVLLAMHQWRLPVQPRRTGGIR